jgi:hypothetical protein
MVPKPAHSGCESWLQSVWDVGRYLSRYPVAGVAFEAPGTCKQCTPQITAICGGAQEQPVTKLQASLAPANDTGSQPHSYVPTCRDANYMHWVMPTFSCAAVWPCNTAELKYLPWGCHVAPMWRIRPRNVQSYLYTAVSAVRHRLVGMYLTQGSLSSNPRNRCICRAWHNCGGNLQTKLARRRAGAQYLWLRCPGRGSGAPAPRSPL